MTLRDYVENSEKLSEVPSMPALFIGHGSPMNGILDTSYARGWKKLAEDIPLPCAILSISAHWLTEGTFVHIAPHPKTIHDFYGFPEELYTLFYPAEGDVENAREVQKRVRGTAIKENLSWGIDHGTWIVLRRMYPDANIPVFQMSIDMTKPLAWHFALGKELAFLRKKGVLIMGSGNIVHNLRQIDFEEGAKPFDWAIEFDEKAKELIKKGNTDALLYPSTLGRSAEISIPTPEHYIPLLYTLALREKDETLSFPVEGIDHGSISMRSIKIG